MTYDTVGPRHDGDGDVYAGPQATLYALLEGAEGCGSAARSARLAQDDELADFFSRVQEEIVVEAETLLEQRVAE